MQTGLCHIFLQHTSASLLLSENVDPVVQVDLEHFMQRIIRDGDPAYRHTLEGADDMAAHARTLLTQVSLTLPVSDGRCRLGTWQGVFLYEHRYRPHRREIIVTLHGE
jgi:secondary thiamine-phosphate synthase enzyme